MKFNVKLVLLIATLLLSTSLIYSINLIHQTNQSEETLEKINEHVTLNLGSLNEKITSKEVEALVQLYMYQLPINERRLQENQLYPGPIETLLLKLINNKLTAYTKKYLNAKESVTDKIGYDPFHNYEIKTLRKLKDYLSEADYQSVITLYSADRIHDSVAREKLLDIFAKYPQINKEITVNYLIDYKPTTHNATYELNESLTLEDKAIMTPNISFISDDVQQLYDEIFNDIKRLLPKEYLQQLETVTFLINLEDAKVIDSDEALFNLIIDPIDYEMLTDKRPFYESILHQYFHFVTLSDTQLIESQNYDMSVYCEKDKVFMPQSYLNMFYQFFWKPIYDDRLINNLSFEFYIRHQPDFVGPYASTDPIEDLAETFAHFVLNETPEGATRAEEKIRYFYEFENWVEFRETFRGLINTN
ncbi:MAG TPA: hypothetical protein DCY20_00395 [Firmicutes bacterium]|nr:hypothetical protein [Bacillota bacterium]